MTSSSNPETALTVSDLVAVIKQQLEGDFQQLSIEGEISNLSQSATGHWYFSLSDNDASISCCLFRMQALQNPVLSQLKNGDKVTVSGHLSIYAKRTAIQIIVKKIESSGAKGSLKEQFEKLKKQLSQEGLFDLTRKKPIPDYVKKIAVVTAENAAALRDFLTVMERRSIEYTIHIYPSLVQGEQAPASMMRAIDLVQDHGDYDVLVVTRGGGSQEDLWCFNNEQLIRKLATCTIPVISAVGHEVDYTLCDFVADLRCETPTAAAEVLSSKQLKIMEQFSLMTSRLRSLLLRQKQYLDYLSSFLKPAYQIKSLQNLFLKRQSQLQVLKPLSSILEKRCYALEVSLEQTMERNSQKLRDLYENRNRRVQKAEAMLSALDPYQVLNRGYSILSDFEGKIITSQKKLASMEIGHKLRIRFHDGSGVVTKAKES